MIRDLLANEKLGFHLDFSFFFFLDSKREIGKCLRIRDEINNIQIF